MTGRFGAMIRGANMSIRVKLTALVALVVIVLAGGLSLVSYIFARRILSEQIEQRLVVVASDRRQLLRSHLQRHKERVESTAARLGVTLLRADEEEEDASTTLTNALRVERLTTAGEVRQIWLWNERGEIIAQEPPDGWDDAAPALGELRRTVMMEPQRTGLRYTLDVAAPVMAPHAATWGLGMRVDVTTLMMALSDPVGLGETGEVRLVVPTPRGWRFVLPDRLGRPVRDIVRSGAGAWSEILGSTEKVGQTVDDRGVDVLVAYLPMTESGWGILAKMDAREAYAPIAWLRQMFIAVETTVLVLGVMAAFFLGRRVSRPIQQLAAAARELAAGREASLATVGGSAEVAALGAAFRQMAEELAHSQAILEQRVRERTAALEQTNEALQKEIAERRRAEETLRQQQMLLQSLMDNIPDCIYFKDEHSRFIRVNRAFGQWCGVSPDEVVGKTDFHIFTSEHAQQAFDDEQEVMRTGKPIIAKEEKETWPDGRITWVSTTKLPLRDAEGRIIGTFGVSRDITARKQAEQRLERYAQALAQRTIQTQEDLALAREIQVAFLPRNLPRDSDRVRLVYEYRPASTLGGDFFDVWRVGEHGWGVLQCDVMGHGLRASLVTAYLRGLIQQMQGLADRPGEFLSAINSALVETLDPTRTPIFASAFYFVLDSRNGELRWARAGHPAPIWIRRRAGELRALDGNDLPANPVLGLFADIEVRALAGLLEPGDGIVLFTDGLTDASGGSGEVFGVERVRAILERHQEADAATWVRQLMAGAQQFASGGEFGDDVCVVAVEWLGPHKNARA